MAGLSPGPDTDASPAGDRAQILLVGAFGIAVFLLVLAGVLNAVAYTESLATRGDDLGGGRDVAAFQEDVRHGAGGIVARINENGGSFSTKEYRLARSVANWSDAVERHYVRDVTGVNVSLNRSRTTEGSLIAQRTARPLTNNVTTSNWTLATGVSKTRRFRLNVSRTSLDTGACTATNCFALVVDDGTDTWNVSLNQSAVVVERSGSVRERCDLQVGDDPVVVDVTGGTVNGRECEPLSFAEGVSTPYDIRYRNGGRAVGTYRLVVDLDVAAVDGSDYAAGESPAVTPAVYAAAVRLTYRTPRLVYRTEIRVARGEPDG